MIANSVASQFTVEMICDYEDISIADNLPNITCKEFIKNFANLFQLKFALDDNSKTVRFLTESEFINNDFPYDISKRVIERSVNYIGTGVPNNIKIGYDNDKSDFELNEFISEFFSTLQSGLISLIKKSYFFKTSSNRFEKSTGHLLKII